MDSLVKLINIVTGKPYLSQRSQRYQRESLFFIQSCQRQDWIKALAQRGKNRKQISSMSFVGSAKTEFFLPFTEGLRNIGFCKAVKSDLPV